jgi:hypothetical protein
VKGIAVIVVAGSQLVGGMLGFLSGLKDLGDHRQLARSSEFLAQPAS